MNHIDLKTTIKILLNQDEIFLRETKCHDKDLIKVIKLYCLLNREDYIYNYDFYKSIDRYNQVIKTENKVRKLVMKKPKPYMSDWVGSDFLGG